MIHFRSPGKIIIFGEYFVLDGAKAFAIPTQLGQFINIEYKKNISKKIIWNSFNSNNKLWFKAVLNKNFEIESTNHFKIANYLQNILRIAAQINCKWIEKKGIYTINTHLEFPNEWGLGTSSTLITNIAKWTKVDPYLLLQNSFKGSGYDIACAMHNKPITYQLKEKKKIIEKIHWNPSFKDEIFFIYTGKKTITHSAIKYYENLKIDKIKIANTLNILNENFFLIQNIEEFENWIEKHENIISNALQIPKIKEQFLDNSFSIKSLGAWGGDFIMTTRKESAIYFLKNGYNTILKFSEIFNIS